VQNLSCEKKIDLPENEPVGGTHFLLDSSAQRLVLTERCQCPIFPILQTISVLAIVIHPQFLLSSCHLSSTVWVSCYLAMISSLSHGVPVFVQNCPTQSKLIGCPVRNVSCISYLLEEL